MRRRGRCPPRPPNLLLPWVATHHPGRRVAEPAPGLSRGAMAFSFQRAQRRPPSSPPYHTLEDHHDGTAMPSSLFRSAGRAPSSSTRCSCSSHPTTLPSATPSAERFGNSYQLRFVAAGKRCPVKFQLYTPMLEARLSVSMLVTKLVCRSSKLENTTFGEFHSTSIELLASSFVTSLDNVNPASSFETVPFSAGAGAPVGKRTKEKK